MAVKMRREEAGGLYGRRIRRMFAAAAASALLTGCGTTAVKSPEALSGSMGKGYDSYDTWEAECAQIEAARQELIREQEELAAFRERMPAMNPALPDSGAAPADFAPAGWELKDCAELDFNEDGVTDYVGVLQVVREAGYEGEYWQYPRILFGVASSADGGYTLSFQDVNLIRTANEGGVFGDPYLPLEAEGTSFSTFSYGGSAWKWAEVFTYTYKSGTWYLTQSETWYGYGGYTTSYEADDWEKGVGLRKQRSSEWADMEAAWESWENMDEETEPPYDIVYEISLDEAPTLAQAGMRWWLASDRITDWTVSAIVPAEGVSVPEDKIELPEDAYIRENDENGGLYTFFDEDSGKYYLALYRWQDRELRILCESETGIVDLAIYGDKIYYTTEIIEEVAYKTVRDGVERTVQGPDTVGIVLHRMNTDGTGTETVFEYRYPGADEELMEGAPPYIALIYEISGGEIVAEVYIGDEPHPFYRMNMDGSRLRRIGQIPKE